MRRGCVAVCGGGVDTNSRSEHWCRGSTPIQIRKLGLNFKVPTCAPSQGPRGFEKGHPLAYSGYQGTHGSAPKCLRQAPAREGGVYSGEVSEPLLRVWPSFFLGLLCLRRASFHPKPGNQGSGTLWHPSHTARRHCQGDTGHMTCFSSSGRRAVSRTPCA